MHRLGPVSSKLPIVPQLSTVKTKTWAEYLFPEHLSVVWQQTELSDLLNALVSTNSVLPIQKTEKTDTNCSIDVQSVVVNIRPPPVLLTPCQSVCVLVAICLPTWVSAALGPALSDRLSTADSTRSSDDDSRPGVPHGHSAVHIHSQSAVVLHSAAVRVAPL